MSSLAAYEAEMSSHRARLDGTRWAAEILSPTVSAERLERFLIHFCSLGFQMTDRVEQWIRRAGDRSVELGFVKVGEGLRAHARHEAGHEQMMVNDTKALVDRRRRAGRTVPDAAALLDRPATAGVLRYVDLHEKTIAGTTPFAQIAIEYEIERISTTHGPAFVGRCIQVLGADVKACMSFVQDHVALDVGHTRFNQKQIDALLASRPEVLPALVAGGAAALDAYAAFLEDCTLLSEREWSARS